RCLSVFSRMSGLHPFSDAPGEAQQRVLDPAVDLDALALEARALAIRSLAGDANLGDAVLPRRRLDGGDLRGEGAPVVLQRNEQVRPERDEHVAAGPLVDG